MPHHIANGSVAVDFSSGQRVLLLAIRHRLLYSCMYVAMPDSSVIIIIIHGFNKPSSSYRYKNTTMIIYNLNELVICS